MASHRIRAEIADSRRERAAAHVSTDPETVAGFLEDAAHYPGGHAPAVAFPHSEADVAELVRLARHILPVGAQSSLTGGATPMGELVLTTAGLTGLTILGRSRVQAGAGVALTTLEGQLALEGLYFPPSPTFRGAFAGGVVSTNAAGAATFKDGATRHWVEGLRVVLSSGEVLAIQRGEVYAHPDGYFEVETISRGRFRVPVPSYVMPDVPKRSAGYFAAPRMDLVDLFVGSEGTLGIITEVTFRVLPSAPVLAVALVSTTSDSVALGVVVMLREASMATWRTGDPSGIDVSAIEMLDRRSIAVLREDGTDRQHGVSLPSDTQTALIVQIELPQGTTREDAHLQIAGALEPGAPDTPLVRLCRLFEEAGVLNDVELAMPGDRRRAEQIFAVREAVPSGVNRRVALAKRAVDTSIEKTAADMIVPFAQFASMMQIYRDGYERRGLDYAIWGHISDGNVHPNVIPRSVGDVEAGREAILEFGRAVTRLGGCPLAEHGVGRSPVKQALLRQLYGNQGIEQMRQVKCALDPDWKLAPGVLFPNA